MQATSFDISCYPFNCTVTGTLGPNMAPAANTARPRRGAADTDSDAEFQAYNGRLKEAGAARARLRKVLNIFICLVWSLCPI